MTCITADQFQEIKDELRRQHKRTERLIKANGRMIEVLLVEVKQLSIPVFSVYKQGKLIKLGGAK